MYKNHSHTHTYTHTHTHISSTSSKFQQVKRKVLSKSFMISQYDNGQCLTGVIDRGINELYGCNKHRNARNIISNDKLNYTDAWP